MRKTTLAGVLVAAALVATLVAAIPGAFAGGAEPKPWNGVIPAGKAITGVVGGGCFATKINDQCAATASIFPIAPVALDAASMGVAGGLVEHPECAGSAQKPLPAAGILCIYPNEDEAVNILRSGEGSLTVAAGPVHNGRRGFKVVWNAALAGNSQFYAVWVYQAPEAAE